MERYVSTKPLPFFYVGSQVTADRIARYKTQKHNLLSQALGRQDTKSIWYSKEHFVKLVEEIEYAGGDGIRVQFGVYEDGHEFAGQLGLLFNVTREIVTGDIISHTNVVLENEPDFPDRSALPREIIAFPGEENIGNSKDFNTGSPCPPRCDFDPSGDGGDPDGGGNP